MKSILRMKYLSILAPFILLFTATRGNAEVIVVKSIEELRKRQERIRIVYPESQPKIVITTQSIGSGIVRRGVAVYQHIEGFGYVMQYFYLCRAKGLDVQWNAEEWELSIDWHDGKSPQKIKFDEKL